MSRYSRGLKFFLWKWWATTSSVDCFSCNDISDNSSIAGNSRFCFVHISEWMSDQMTIVYDSRLIDSLHHWNLLSRGRKVLSKLWSSGLVEVIGMAFLLLAFQSKIERVIRLAEIPKKNFRLFNCIDALNHQLSRTAMIFVDRQQLSHELGVSSLSHHQTISRNHWFRSISKLKLENSQWRNVSEIFLVANLKRSN